MTDPFPPKIIIVAPDGQQTICGLRDVVEGVPHYALPCPDCGPKPQPVDRFTADMTQGLALIAKALGPMGEQ